VSVPQTFSFEFDRGEHVRACRAIHRHALRPRWTKPLLRAGYVLFLVFVLVNMAADLQREQFPAMLPALAVLVASPFLATLSGHAQARQWLKLNPPGSRTVTVTMEEERFRSSNHVGAGEVRWPAAKQVVETSDFLLVYVTKGVAHYLPKRAIPDGQLPGVRQLISSQVGSRFTGDALVQ
jgi:hypothetical protein